MFEIGSLLGSFGLALAVVKLRRDADITGLRDAAGHFLGEIPARRPDSE